LTFAIVIYEFIIGVAYLLGIKKVEGMGVGEVFVFALSPPIVLATKPDTFQSQLCSW
jgi:hypothetical protein